MSDEQQRTDVPNEERNPLDLDPDTLEKLKIFVLRDAKVFSELSRQSLKDMGQQEYEVESSFLSGMLYTLARLQGHPYQVSCDVACTMSAMLMDSPEKLAAMAARLRAERED